MTDRIDCPTWCVAKHDGKPAIRLHRSSEIVVPVSGDIETMAELLPLADMPGDEIADAFLAKLARVWLEVRIAGVSHHDAGP